MRILALSSPDLSTFSLKILNVSGLIFFFLVGGMSHRDQQNVDFTKVGGHVHQLKGSSSRFIFLHFIDLIESKIIVFSYPILYLYIVTA